MKNKFLSRIGQWHTPPYLRKCLTSLKALTLLLVMLMSVNVWGNVTYEKVTSSLTDWSGDYLIVHETNKVAFDGSLTKLDVVKNNFSVTISEGTPNTITLSDADAAAKQFTITASETSGEYYIQSASGYYIWGTSSNGLSSNTALKSAKTNTITWANNTFTIKGKDGSKTLSFNIATDQLRFRYLGSTLIQLYKKQSGDDPDPTEPSLSVSPTTIDFCTVAVGGSVVAQDVTATLTNTDYAIATLSGTNADAFEITAGEELTETGTITVQPKAATLAVEGTYSATLEVEADGVDDPKTVTLLLKVAAPTGTFVKFTGDELKEGDYVICVGTDAMKNSVTSSRLDYASVTVSSDKITNPEASVIWHIAPVSEGVWSIFNVVYDSDKGGYAAGTGADNKAQILAATTDVSTETKAQWTCAKVAAGYNFENVGNKASSKNAKLKKNGTYGFACYADFSDITLYKTYVEPAKSAVTFASCENGSVGATVNSSAISSGAIVDEDAVVTLTNTPADGYKLDAYDVYKTGESETKVTVKEESGVYTFKMPAYAVTVSATFETAKVLNDIDINTDAVKKEFWKGETFTSENLVVTAHFSTGDETVEPTSVTGYNMNNVGEQTVTVTFKEGLTEKSKTYTINVKSTTNTKETAFTVAEAIDIIGKGLASTTDWVYVKGIVSQIDSYNSTYKSITYWISDDGTTTNQFEIYGGKNIDNTGFNSKEDLSVEEVLIIYGLIKDYKGTKEMDANNYIVERVKVLQSITLSGEYPTEFSLNDGFSHEGQVVTASYNYGEDQIVTEFAEWSGYNMSQAGTQEVTVSYTENSIEKTATYNITITKSCDSPITITKGAEVNGTFELNNVGYFCLDDEEGNKVSTVLTAVPAEHYHLASVTAEGCTIGEIAGNQCTISNIVADVTITANFAEDAKATATFVKGEEAATGDAPTNIEQYVGEEITLPANTFAYAGHVFVGWSDGNNVYQANDKYTLTVNTEFTATWNELPIWATTYTSNVTLSGNKVKLAEAYQPTDYPEDGYDAKKDGSGSAAASISVKVPANTTGLHYHLFAWKGEGGKTVSIKKGETVLATFTNIADDGVSGSSTTYELINNPVDAYGYVALEDITEETTITFSTSAKNNRICLFGVNAVAPASITIDPASKDFGEVKQGFDAEQVFALTPNAFATGTITAEIDGEGFSASAVENNEVTVTFAPTEIKDYSATLIIKHDGTQMCTATLTGKGITATTPTIDVDKDNIDFGKVKQDATVADQILTVTLSNLDAAAASIDDNTYFSIDKTELVTGDIITISATASSVGPKNATITITGEGATTKTITVKMDVTSKWAGEYTSNVEVGSDVVVIGGKNYDAIKTGSGSAQGSTTITVPEGAYALHFHAAGWNTEDVTLAVKNGDTELGSFSLYADAGVKSSSPFTLAGENYDTDQYFHVEFDALEAETEFTFAATSGNRFVLYGVNQEGGIVPMLDHLTITGTTKTEYEEGDEFDPSGLTVNAIYTLADVEQEPVDVTEDVEWEFTPATLTAGSYDVTVKATYENKEVSTTVAVEVTAATPEIEVDPTAVGFGTVLKDDVVDAKTIAVTLKAIANATVEVSGEGKDAFNVTPTSLTESGNITITPITTAAGEFTATITISADGAESKTITVTMNVTDGNLPKEKVDFTVVYSSLSGNETADFTGYDGVTFNIVADKGEGSNAPKYYANGSAVRAYKGNKITISSEKTIAFILINHTGKSYQDVEATVDKGTLKVNEAYSMWTLGATSGTITLAATVRFDNIIVFYEYDEVVRSAQSENQIGTGCQTLDIVAVKGATLYQVNYTTGSYLEFMEVTYPVKAGMPIIMQADNTNDGKIELIYGEKNEEAEVGLSKDGLIGYIGADTKEIPNDEGYYVFKGGMLRPALDNYTTSGHAYVKLSEVPTEDQMVGSPAPRRRLSVGIERSMPTGFETIMMQKGMNKVIMNNQLYLIRDGKLFNAQGALVK